ncbi:MAG: hypothetical protein U0821_03100 [Chloroflexota bacterium]
MDSVRDVIERVRADLQMQWERSLGHQQRHPIRVRLAFIDELLAGASDDAALITSLTTPEPMDDPWRAQLRADLAEAHRRHVSAE